MVCLGELACRVGIVVKQVGDQAEQLRCGAPGDGDGVFDDAERGPLHLSLQHALAGDLIDRPGAAAQLIQQVLGQAEAGMISRMAGGLHPPVAAHHRGRHRHRLQPDHQVPRTDAPGTGHGQCRAAIPAQPRPRRGTQVSGADGDHARPAQQAHGSLPGGGGPRSRGNDRGYARLAGRRSSALGEHRNEKSPQGTL